jgi:hypothetical protein
MATEKQIAADRAKEHGTQNRGRPIEVQRQRAPPRPVAALAARHGDRRWPTPLRAS